MAILSSIDLWLLPGNQLISGLLSILSLASFVWIFIFFFVFRKTFDRDQIEKIKNSDSYRAQCEAIDHNNQVKKKEIETYNQQLRSEYDDVLQQHQDALFEWEKEHLSKIENIEKSLNEAEIGRDEIAEDLPEIPPDMMGLRSLRSILSYLKRGDSLEDAIRLTHLQFDKDREEVVAARDRAAAVFEEYDEAVDEVNRSIRQRQKEEKALRDKKIRMGAYGAAGVVGMAGDAINNIGNLSDQLENENN